MAVTTAQCVILKGIGGFYYVHYNGELIECKAGGRLRLDKERKPAVGDKASIEITDGAGYITQILPRRNFLPRPPIANIDRLFIVASQAMPSTDTLLIDKVLLIAALQGIEPIILLNKSDLDASAQLKKTYSLAGIRIISTSAQNGEGVDEVRDMLGGNISAFTGNSAIGKSSLLNCLMKQETMPIGEMSKISRGKHTTRHVELFPVAGGFIADTPGFSSFDIVRMEHAKKEDLQNYFPEFEPYIGHCRFNGCAHNKEPNCAVTHAALDGKIAKSRLDNYRTLYEELSALKDWENK